MPIGPLPSLPDLLPGGGRLPGLPGLNEAVLDPLLKGGPEPDLLNSLPPGIAKNLLDGGMDALPPGLARQLANGTPTPLPPAPPSLATPSPPLPSTPAPPAPPVLSGPTPPVLSTPVPVTPPTLSTPTPPGLVPSLANALFTAPPATAAPSRGLNFLGGLLRGNSTNPALPNSASLGSALPGRATPNSASFNPALLGGAARAAAERAFSTPMLPANPASTRALPTAPGVMAFAATPAAQPAATTAFAPATVPTASVAMPTAPAVPQVPAGTTATPRAPAETIAPQQARPEPPVLRPATSPPPSVLATPVNSAAAMLTLAVVPLAVPPLQAPVVDARGITVIANDRAAIVRPDAATPQGHTVDGPWRSLRRRRQVARATIAQWLSAWGLAGSTVHARAGYDSARENRLGMQWLSWLLAAIAYGCLALALIVFLGDGLDVGGSARPAWPGTAALAVGLLAAVAAWWLARRDFSRD